jgi:hypothetical protein
MGWIDPWQLPTPMSRAEAEEGRRRSVAVGLLHPRSGWNRNLSVVQARQDASAPEWAPDPAR